MVWGFAGQHINDEEKDPLIHNSEEKRKYASFSRCKNSSSTQHLTSLKK